MKKKNNGNYPKSTLRGKSCFGKTIYPTMKDAEVGATIIWGKDPSANRADLHGYECPDGCRIHGRAGYHIGHKSYYKKQCEDLSLSQQA